MHEKIIILKEMCNKLIMRDSIANNNKQIEKKRNTQKRYEYHMKNFIKVI